MQVAPPFGLTLRAMLGKCLRPTVSGRLALGLVSVLALLALSVSPAAAQSAYEVEYNDAPPVSSGGKKPKGNTQADKSDTGGQGAQTGVGSGGSGGDSSGGSSERGANAPAGKGDNGQGSPGPGSDKKQAKALQPGDPAAATTSDDDGGSSPLVPILIAILVLAAITVAVVMIRQRRQGADSGDSGTPVSPEAN